MDLVEKSRQLPTQPGVYLFKNAAGQVIYVGKAKDLRARVRTYFLAGQLETAKTGSLLRDAAELESIVVDTEAEALALENTLIKQWQPRFNVLLRDDKTYPYIRLSREPFPRVYVTRRLADDGSEFFGPFFPAGFAYRLAHFIHKHFLVPSCRVDLTRFHPRPCLEYHIHRCLGPCVEGLTTPERYRQAVEDVRLLLAGKQGDLARDLRRRRDQAAAREDFEAAAGLRDLLSVLEDLQQRQKMHAVSGEDTDVVGFCREGARAALNLFHLRHGRVVDRREFFWESLPQPEAEDRELLGALLKQIYLPQPYLPPRIAAPLEFEDRELLAAALSAQRGAAVEIAVPQRGGKRALVALAEKNARLAFQRRFRSAVPAGQAAADWQALAAALALPLGAEPGRVECFDISHFQGAETVAAMTVWEAGALRRSEYRKFKLHGVVTRQLGDALGASGRPLPGIEAPPQPDQREGGSGKRWPSHIVDDFRSLEEVVHRRYQRRLAEGAPLPNLVLVDGGIGQLHAAHKALLELGLGTLPLASLAKREELVYVLGRESTPLRLDPHAAPLRILQLLRDEAHRFAITFHRRRRGKAALRSELLAAPGIGPAAVRKLLARFGSLAAVRAAPAEALAQVLPAARARALWERLHALPAN